METPFRRTTCPLDPSAQSEVVADLPYAGDIFVDTRLVSPTAAGQRYTIRYAPKPDFYWIETLLPPPSKTDGHTYGTPDLRRWTHATEEAILYRLLLGQSGTLKVFDFGMGDGTALKIMMAFGMEAHGYDVNPQSPAHAQRCGITFAELASYPDNFFDLILAQEVFEHLRDPLVTAKLIAQKLKRGGIFKISTPGDKSVKTKLAHLAASRITAKEFSRLFNSIEPFEHINLFSNKALRYMARSVGLEVRKIPLLKFFQATAGLYSWKQLNRAFYNPLKRHAAQGTLLFLTKK